MTTLRPYSATLTRANRQTPIVQQTTCDPKLLRMIREDIIDELIAINNYSEHINATTNETAKAVLTSIRDEERMHIGELLALIDALCPEEATLRNNGREEANEIINSRS
ncbi:MAG: ubiquinone biosynthesis protein COQ7 [Clostridia bacterium]|nr:ubiquinone biosynthesis protein COQ7 [Clostridia bacterium]